MKMCLIDGGKENDWKLISNLRAFDDSYSDLHFGTTASSERSGRVLNWLALSIKNMLIFTTNVKR
jgi:hypothetical protein